MPHVTFIHGIANKPPKEKLKKIWLDSLARDILGNDDGLDLGALGITTSMIYWADVLYEGPAEESFQETVSDFESTEIPVTFNERDPDMSWRENLKGGEKKTVDSLAAKFSFDILLNDDEKPPREEIAPTLERIPLPWFVKRRLMKWLLRDVHHYLFNSQFSPRPGTVYRVQEEIRSRVLNELNAVNSDKHYVVSHSMGTIILYDCLKRVEDTPSIDGFMTIGCPLGINEVQDKLKPEWTRQNGYPEKLKGPWINVYDYLDPVTGFDGNIASDFKRNGEEIIEVINEENWGAWRHNITKYLSEPKLRAALKKMIHR